MNLLLSKKLIPERISRCSLRHFVLILVSTLIWLPLTARGYIIVDIGIQVALDPPGSGAFRASVNGASQLAGGHPDYPGITSLETSAFVPGLGFAGGVAGNGATITRYTISVGGDVGCYDVFINGVQNLYDTSHEIGYPINVNSFGFSIEFRPRKILYKFDKAKEGGRYTLPADGQSFITASPNGPDVGDMVYAILSPSLGARVDSSSGRITAGTTPGTITVRGIDTTYSICHDELVDLVDCKSCSEGGACGESGGGGEGGKDPGVVSVLLASVDTRMHLGWALHGASAGFLQIHEETPSALLASPQKLQYNFIRSGVDVVKVSGVLRQVKTPDCLADIVISNAYHYDVKFYSLTNVLSKTGGSTYGVTNSPFATISVTNLNADTNKLRIIQKRDGSETVFDYSALTNGWQLTNGGGLRVETKTTAWSETNTVRTVTRTIEESGGAVVYRSTQTYRTNATYGERLIEETFGSGANALTNSYVWTSSGFLQQATRGDGSWEYHVYDPSNRATNVFSGFKNQGVTTNKSDCRMLEHIYTTNVISGAGDTGYAEKTIPRRTIEFLLGEEIGRSYFVALPGERRQIQCTHPGAAWDNSSNLVTVTKLFTNGFYANHVKSVLHPDGTIDISQYSTLTMATNGSISNLTLVILRGHPDSSGTNIDAGISNVLRFDVVGQLLTNTVIDAPSGITVSQETHQYDAHKRNTNTTYLDGTSRSVTYDCCTVSSMTEPDGTVVNYTYDALKRLAATIRSGITLSNTYDAYGNILSTVRYGTNGTVITNLISTFDDAARLTSSRDALGSLTTYTNYVDGSGQSVRTTSYPDSATRTEKYFRDGALAGITGSAMRPVRYTNGVETSGADSGRFYTQEIKLDSNGNDTGEWTKNYRDTAGRVYKTLFSDDAFSQSFFNAEGQLTKQIDPDGVATLFQYNNQGEVEYGALDIDGTPGIGFGDTDRITRTLTFVTNNGIANVRRTITYAWATNSSTVSNLASVLDVSTDGLRAWSAHYGRTNQTRVRLAGGGTRYETNTVPFGAYTVSEFANGRLTAVTEYASNKTQVGATTFGYDAHGRRSTVTDARTGTTTYTFNNADQIASITTPGPAAGQSAQTTTNYFDSMGRIWKAGLPDNTSVTNEYFMTGDLKKTYGSRTYPVEYAYDAQGRLTNMTTWTGYPNTGAASTQWRYDPRGFLTNKVYADGNGPGYTYTPAGRLKTRTWARGVTTTYATNAAGELASISYSDTTPGVTNTYDRRGRLVTVVQGGSTNMTNVLGYVEAGEMQSEVSSGGKLGAYTWTMSGTIDNYGRRLSVVVHRDSSQFYNNAFNFDFAGRMSRSYYSTYRDAQYSYLTNSPLVEKIKYVTDTTNVQMTTTYQYDNLNRVTSMVTTTNGSSDPAFVSRYEYNTANQRTSLTNIDNSRWTYGYDGLGQVTSGKKYWSDGTIAAGQQFEYSFDDIGNRKTAANGGNEWGSNLRYQNYTVNNLNQYTQRTVPDSVDVIGVASNAATVTVNNQSTYRKGDYFRSDYALNNTTGAIYVTLTNIAALNNGTNADTVTNITGKVFVPKTTEAFAYDADGNLTNDGRWAYTWDAENRLVKMESFTNALSGSKRRLEFTYDYRGRRVWKKVTNLDTGGVTERRYIYYEWLLLHELWENSGAVSRFLWGPDLSGTFNGAAGVGGLAHVEDVQFSANETKFFPVFDGNGNVQTLVNASTCVTEAMYEYGPFGELIRRDGRKAAWNPIRFSTKFQDEDSDLLYYGYRYYNPSIGRWTSRDPLNERGFAKVNPHDHRKADLQLYAFVRNNPVVETDFLGLWGTGCPCGERAAQINAVGGLRAYQANNLAAEAFEETAKTLLSGSGEGPAAAFRHCFWLCRMTQELNPGVARIVGETHERCGKNSPGKKAMDLANNEAGIEFGKTRGNCRNLCLGAVYEGTLKLAPSGQSPPLIHYY